MEQINLVNSYNFSIAHDVTQIVNLPTRIPHCDSHSPALLDLFFLLTLVFGQQWFSLHWEILIMLAQFLFNFHQNHNRMPHFIAELMIIFVLIGTVFVII